MSTPDGVAESLFRQMEEFGAGSGLAYGQRDDGTPTRLVYCALGDTATDALVVLKALDDYHANLPDGAEPGKLRVTITSADTPASGEPSGADAVVREALAAIKKAHAAVDDLCNGRRWTMSIPARPDADHDLVIDDALTKAERVIRTMAGLTAPGAPEEGAGE